MCVADAEADDGWGSSPLPDFLHARSAGEHPKDGGHARVPPGPRSAPVDSEDVDDDGWSRPPTSIPESFSSMYSMLSLHS